MSKLGKALIEAIEDAQENGLTTLQASPDLIIYLLYYAKCVKQESPVPVKHSE